MTEFSTEKPGQPSSDDKPAGPADSQPEIEDEYDGEPRAKVPRKVRYEVPPPKGEIVVGVTVEYDVVPEEEDESKEPPPPTKV